MHWDFSCLSSVNRYHDPAMPRPLVSYALLETFGAGPIMAVESRDAEVRDTPMHQHAAGQLLGSLSGLLQVSTATATWVVPATHAVWLPPHAPHGLRSVGPFEGWSVYVIEEASGPLPSETKVLKLSSLLCEVVARVSTWRGPPRDERELRLAEVLLDEVAALEEEPFGLPMPRDPRIASSASAVLADLAANKGLEASAAAIGVAPRTLARRFLAETGFTFGAWRQRARCMRAMEALAEGKSVTEVAFDLGYSNVSAFVEMFKRSVGVTPGRYGG